MSSNRTSSLLYYLNNGDTQHDLFCIRIRYNLKLLLVYNANGFYFGLLSTVNMLNISMMILIYIYIIGMEGLSIFFCYLKVITI